MPPRPHLPERRTAFVAAVVSAALLALAALPSLPPALATLGIDRPTAGPRFEVAAEAARSPRAALLEDVAKPLERRLRSLPGVIRVESRIEDGRAVLRLSAERGADPDALHLAIVRRTEGLALPLDRLTITALPEREPAIEVLLLGGGGAARRSAYARGVLLPEIGRAPGAGQVETIGDRPLRVAVTPLPSPLAARGLTPLDVVDRLRTVGTSLPAGRVRDGAAIRPLSVRERIESLEQLGALEIQGPAGATPLSEVAHLTTREIADGSWVRALDGSPGDGLLLRLYPAPGGDAANLVAEVERTLDRLGPSAAAAGFRLSVLPSRDRALLASRLRYLPAALLIATLTASILAFGFGRRRAALAPLLAAVVLGLATAVASCRSGGSGGERVRVRFDFPGDPSPETSRSLGETLALRLSREVAPLGARPALLFFRRSSAPDLRASLGLPGGSDPAGGGHDGDPDPYGERGRLDLAFPSAAQAARARSILSSSLARIPEVSGRVEGVEALEIEVSAPDPTELEALVRKVERTLAGAAGRESWPEPGGSARSGLRLRWDESLLAGQGVEAGALDEQVRAGLGGFTAGRVEIAGVEPEIWIEPASGHPGGSPRPGAGPDAVEVLGLLPLRPVAADATAVPLRALARIERRPEPAPLLRVDGRPARFLAVPAETGLDRHRLERLLEKIPLARGERLNVRGEVER